MCTVVFLEDFFRLNKKKYNYILTEGKLPKDIMSWSEILVKLLH